MVVKSLKSEVNVEHLDKSFEILRGHKMILNLVKCMFGMLAGKFLIFIITQSRVEPCP